LSGPHLDGLGLHGNAGAALGIEAGDFDGIDQLVLRRPDGISAREIVDVQVRSLQFLLPSIFPVASDRLGACSRRFVSGTNGQSAGPASDAPFLLHPTQHFVSQTLSIDPLGLIS
jgi:hypothetical protein